MKQANVVPATGLLIITAYTYFQVAFLQCAVFVHAKKREASLTAYAPSYFFYIRAIPPHVLILPIDRE